MTHIYSYTPLIYSKRSQPIEVFLNSNAKVVARINISNKNRLLPVKGYPQGKGISIGVLRRFFSQSYLTIERTIPHRFDYIRVVPRLPGGGVGVSEQDILPMYPGYAIGNIISKAVVLLPLLSKKLKEREEHVKKLEVELQALKRSGNQKAVSSLSFQKGQQERAYKKLKQEESEIKRQYSSFSIEEALPVDFEQSEFRTLENSFESERTSDIVLTSQTKDVAQKIQVFVSDLSINNTSPYVAEETLRSLSNRIQGMIDEQVDVRLIGSFITLKKSQKLDPIVIRKGAEINKNLKANPDHYYVLTEAVLGGLFLGFGESHKLKGPESRAGKISQITIFSFVSQGAIPTIPSDEKNLWGAYSSWKKALVEGYGSGYPVGFKVRCLKEIFDENKVAYFQKPAAADEDQAGPALAIKEK